MKHSTSLILDEICMISWMLRSYMLKQIFPGGTKSTAAYHMEIFQPYHRVRLNCVKNSPGGTKVSKSFQGGTMVRLDTAFNMYAAYIFSYMYSRISIKCTVRLAV